MKPLLVLRKTKPLWFNRKLFFDSCKSLLVLLVRKPFDWEIFYKSFICFLENPRQLQWLKIVRVKNNLIIYIIFGISTPWIEFNRSNHWKCSIKKDVFKNFVNFTGKHQSRSLFLIELRAWRRICECSLFSECMTSE